MTKGIHMRSKFSLPMKQKETLTAYMFITPSLAGTLIFVILPLVMVLVLSLSEWNFHLGMKGFQYIGFENYLRILTDEKVAISIKNNLLFSFIQIPLTAVISLLIATLLNKLAMMKQFLRTIYFIPFITSWVSVSIVFKALFNPEGGPINNFLAMLGFTHLPGWFMDIRWSLYALIILTVWHTIGYYMVIILAGLQNISRELYEAATIDGAGPWQKYYKITLPLLSPSLFFIFIMSMINSLKVFDQVAVATQGGPGTSSYVMVYAIYDYAFNYFELGYASSLTWLLFIIILAFTLIQWKMQKKWVVYET
jgi:multiple sugar transport system permease protein